MSRGSRVLVLLLALAPLAAWGATLQPRIVDGSYTSDYPTVALLLAGGDWRFAEASCTGTLIGCRTIVTAAHCVCPGGTSGLTCVPDPTAHSVFLQHGGFVAVEAITVHPSFDFPEGDLAVLRLARPVTGIAPTPLAVEPPPFGTAAEVVGFGRSGGDPRLNVDYGLKRRGDVRLADCTALDLQNDTTLCFSFTGAPGSNTCNGDSGGPLLVPAGDTRILAGVTSGGTQTTCLATDQSWDTSVAYFRYWIAAIAGEALGTPCDDGPQAGQPGTTVSGLAGHFDSTQASVTRQIDVPAGLASLRVALNAEEANGLSDFDLLVKAGAEPTAADADCIADQPNQFGFCEFATPAPGPWFARVQRASGAGAYQLTVTMYGQGVGIVAVCGNGLREAGEACDGSDAGNCLTGCTASCTCADPPPCTQRHVQVRRLRTRPTLRVHALLEDDGTLAGLDPTRTALFLVLDDATTQVQTVIPADDPGWRRGGAGRGVWRWRGDLNGLRRVVLRDRTARRGVWVADVRGRGVGAARTLDRRRARLAVTLGGRCVAE